jgi:CBS-domain-containing membrane protein
METGVLTPGREVKSSFEDEDVTHVCKDMGCIQVRRLPVMDRSKRLVGIVSLGDLARNKPGTAKALRGVSRSGGQHNQAQAGM